MNNRRFAVLIVIAAGLGALVWLDRSARTESVADASLVETIEPNQAGDQRRSSERSPEGEDETASAARNPLGSMRLKSLTHTIERPLFSSSRRPPVKIAKPAKRRPPPPPRKRVKRNSFKLLGVIGGGPHRIALLKDKRNGRHFRVEPGDHIDGWQVDRVGSADVVLTHLRQIVTLSLSQ